MLCASNILNLISNISSLRLWVFQSINLIFKIDEIAVFKKRNAVNRTTFCRQTWAVIQLLNLRQRTVRNAKSKAALRLRKHFSSRCFHVLHGVDARP